MKSITVQPFASVVAFVALALGVAAMWSSGQGIAATPASIKVKATESNSVQDVYEDHGLQMKLIIHRPGHAGH